jgi:superfamily II DNA or RNA helicase
MKIEDEIKKIGKFNDIYDICKKYTTKEKGDLFELITKYIFLVHPNYKNITKNIWLYDEIPHDLVKKFKLPSKDKGIDLLLETKDEYYAIQSKFRSDVYDSVTWTELATFVGQVFVGGIENAIFVTNTYDIDYEITKCDKIRCIYGDFFKDDNLNEEFFNNVKNHINKKQIVYIKKNPFPYQKEAIIKTIEHFKENDRGYLSMACGTGKTFTTCEIDFMMKNRLTLILVPSLYLLSQIYKEWALEYSNDKNVKFILVGSDTDSKEPFLSTDTDDITAKINEYSLNKIIIIATYQSCERLEDYFSEETADLIIFDEAHKTVSDSLFSYALYDKNIKAKKRLFVTATPKIYDKIANNDDDDDEIVSMKNEDLYGKCIYTYQIGQAIEECRLTSYEICLMYITNNEIKNYKNKIINVNGEEMNFHYIATCMMIKKMFNEGSISHLLTYHSSIKNSKDFCDLLNDQLENVNVTQIDGNVNAKNKDKIINKFKTDKKSILTSARVLNEGVNIVEVDSVCFVESRNSGIDIIQCVGRALRLLEGKEIAKILIPILEEDIDENKFKDLVKIVKNLGEYDYQVMECLNNKNTKRKLIKVTPYDSRFTLKNVDVIDMQKLYDSIKISIVGGVYKWKTKYDNFKKYVNENKKLPSQHSNDAEIKILGKWGATQRETYKKKMDIMKNPEIYNTWTEFTEEYKEYFISNREKWLKSYAKIIEHEKEHKELPSKYSNDPEIKKLGKWISHQEGNFAECKKIMASDPEIYNIWVDFVSNNMIYFLNNEESWKYNLDEIKIYAGVNNKFPPISTTLGQWISNQKKHYANKDQIMSTNPEIYNLWTQFMKDYTTYFADNDEKWKENLEKSSKFIDINNKLPPTSSNNPETRTLGYFISNNRKNYEKKINIMKDNPEICALWENFIKKYAKYLLDVVEEWKNHLKNLIEYKNTYKTNPSKHSDDKKIAFLGNFLIKQRQNYKKSGGLMKNEEVYDMWKDYVKKYENIDDNDDKTINIKQKKVQVKKISQKSESESDSDAN